LPRLLSGRQIVQSPVRNEESKEDCIPRKNMSGRRTATTSQNAFCIDLPFFVVKSS
jgi:hypothetical protein